MSESNVVPLRPRGLKDAFTPEPGERVWECFCGCRNFRLHEDGEAECADCGTWQIGYWRPPGAA